MKRKWARTLAIAALFLAPALLFAQNPIALLNVSYDPTRELYRDINAAFTAQWEREHSHSLRIRQSHAGSGKQARAVIDGLEADVVTLALGYDIDIVAARGLIAKDWQQRLPHNSTPYTSVIVFVVRKGNPKAIKDWDDLVKPGVKLVPANPKTSGGARWTYLAGYGYALKKNNGNHAAAKEYITRFYRNARVLDAGARGATTTFIQRRIGDVLVCWENEAMLTMKELAQGEYELVYPSVSILAEPPVSLVDKFAGKHGTREVAEAYLKFLFTDPAQEIAAKHYFRPRNQAIAKRHAKLFKPISTFTIDEMFGGWAQAQQAHFAEGGIFDTIFKENR